MREVGLFAGRTAMEKKRGREDEREERRQQEGRRESRKGGSRAMGRVKKKRKIDMRLRVRACFYS